MLSSLRSPVWTAVGSSPDCGGLGGDDKIDGRNGNDVIYGGDGDDEIKGGNGNDRLFGGDGDDEIKDSNGDEYIDAGNGNNKVEDSNGNDEIYSGSGRDEVKDSNGNDLISTGDGDDKIDDSNGDDDIDAGEGDNEVKAGNGNDLISAGAGNDIIDAGDGNDSVFVTGGTNTIKTSNGDDTIDAGNGNDTIKTGNGRDSVVAREGDDTIDTGNGDDTVNAGPGNDVVKADNGDDYIDAGEGDDDVAAGNGNDTCIAAETRSGCEDVADAPENPLEPAAVTLPTETTLIVGDLPEFPGVVIEIETDGSLTRNDVFVNDATSFYPGLEPVLMGGVLDVTLRDPEAMTSAKLTIPYDPTRLEPNEDPTQSLTLWTFNEATGLWEEAPGEPFVDTITETVTVEVPHFSDWTPMRRQQVPDGTRGAADDWQTVFENIGIRCLADNGDLGLDLALAIDTSGSMQWNDRNAQRVTAAREFVAGLDDNSRVSVIDFDSTATPLNDLLTLTPANRVTVNNSINLTADANGGTNLNAAVLTLINTLNDSPVGRPRVGVLLTDGVSSYSTTLTELANGFGITIFTIGLGAGTSNSVLEGIATGTGGEFLDVANASQLSDNFQLLLDDLIDNGNDEDEDGITDCEEDNGYLVMWPIDVDGSVEITSFARLIFTDFDNPNHDSDGWRDDVEGSMEEFVDDPDIREYYQYLIDAGRTRYYLPVHGLPTDSDTDGDDLGELFGIADLSEQSCGTRWWMVDTDRDGVGDLAECANEDRNPSVPEPVEGVVPDFTLAIHTDVRADAAKVRYLLPGSGPTLTVISGPNGTQVLEGVDLDVVARNRLGVVVFDDQHECVAVTISGFACEDDALQGESPVSNAEVKQLIKDQGVFRQAGGNWLGGTNYQRTTELRSQYVGTLGLLQCFQSYEDADCVTKEFFDAALEVEKSGALVLATLDQQTGLTFTEVEEERKDQGNTFRIDPDKVRRILEKLKDLGRVGLSLTSHLSEDPAETEEDSTRRCLEQEGVLEATDGFTDGLNPCYVLPLYLPSERDTSASGASTLGQAATHRADAIEFDLFKQVQVWRPSGEFEFSDDWFNQWYPCKDREPSPPRTVACDEFPNKAMVGSGHPGQYDVSGDLIDRRATSLELMSFNSNSLEGRRYQRFAEVCAATVMRPVEALRSPFIIIPMTDDNSNGTAPSVSRAVCPDVVEL